MHHHLFGESMVGYAEGGITNVRVPVPADLVDVVERAEAYDRLQDRR